MIKLCYKCRGSISIFLALILLPMFILAGLVVDGSRIYAGRAEVSGAGDMAMNAALSDYNQYLQETYGLFAMSDSIENLQSNVQRYFENTINNTGVLNSSDSYTRSFLQSIGTWFDEDGIDFDNLVQMEIESFALVESPDSAIGNPEILNKQIVEYMKYRGPVNLGKGLLTKIGCLGDTAKQSKALTKQIEYEEELDSIEKVCKTAYEKINAYNNALNNSVYSATPTDEMTNSINSAYDEYKEMVKYIIADNSDEFLCNELTTDSEYSGELETGMSSKSNVDEKLDYLEEKLKEFVELQENAGEYSVKTNAFINSISSLENSNPDNLEDQIGFIKNWKNQEELYSKYYTLVKKYKDNYESASDENADAYESKYNEYNEVLKRIHDSENESSLDARAGNMSSNWLDLAGNHWNSGKAAINSWYTPLAEIITNIDEAISALQTVANKIDEAEAKRASWGESIYGTGGDDTGLAPGDIRTTMSGDYEASAKDLNKAVVEKLIETLQGFKTVFSQIKENLKKNKFYDSVIVDSTGVSQYIGSLTETASDNAGIVNNANTVMNDHYEKCLMDGININGYRKIDRENEDDQFYKYLDNTCGTIASNETKKNAAENTKNEIKSKADVSGSTTADTSGITSSDDIESAVTSEISTALNNLAAGNNNGGVSDFNANSSGTDDKDLASDAKSNLNGIANSLSSLLDIAGSLAEEGRDDLYLEEYVTEMFSCYVTGKGNIPAKALNGRELSASTNQFFGSEAEYVLWGKNSTTDNLNYTKALIYGIRFALNTIYAFTNAEIRNTTLALATAIAGWTGFGVPIVQTVLTVAMSMGESAIDLKELCDGKDVALYKSSSTWNLSVSGALDSASEVAVSVTDGVITDVFADINNLTQNTIDQCAGVVTEYTKKTTQGVVDSVKASVISPLQKEILNVICSADETLSKDVIQEKLTNRLLQVKNTNNTGSGVIGVAIGDAVDKIISEEIATLADTVNGYYENYKNKAISDVNEITIAINNRLQGISDSITDVVKTKVNECANNLSTKVNEALGNAEDTTKTKVKDKVTSAINEYTNELSGALPETQVSKKIDKTSTGVNITMNYKEYLKIFTFMALVNDNAQQAMLCRVAKLIQVNAVKSGEADVNLAKAYTIVEVNAKVNVKTAFLAIDSITDSTDLTSLIGAGKQPISYVGVYGY